MRARWSLALVAALILPLGGCDLFGPSGPGTLEATVTAEEALRGLVLELQGVGVTGFTGRGDTRAYGARVSGDTHRVVLVSQGAGAIRFGIEVEDRSAEAPSVLVVSAVGPDNRPSNATGIQVAVE